jgi:hypothetical protein
MAFVLTELSPNPKIPSLSKVKKLMSFPAIAFCKPYFSGTKNPSLQGWIYGVFAKGNVLGRT